MLHWLTVPEPDLLPAPWKLLLVGDYLGFRLTGEVATDCSSASRTRMMDLGSMEWSERILAALSIAEGRLPRIEASGTPIGRVSAEAAAATGLSETTMVVLGGFDQSCSLLGCGAVAPDTAMISLGTATMVGVSSSKPIIDPERRVTTSCHVLPDTWTLQAPIFTTGAVLRWWRDTCFPECREEAYRRMDELAAAAPIGSDGLSALPHFSGCGSPRWDHRCRGAFVGLSLAHTQGHIIRAILEGVAMEVLVNLEIMEDLGVGVDTVRIVGGGAVSGIWCDIIGDVIGKPSVRMRALEVGTLGAAMLAGVGAGVFSDLTQAVDKMVHSGESSEFTPENHEAYRDVYRRHTAISDRLYGSSVLRGTKSGMQAHGRRDT